VSYRVPAAVMRERLEGFIIADDVVIEDQTEAHALLTLIGARAGDWLRTQVGALPDSGGMVPAPSGGWVFCGRRGRAENWEWLVPRLSRPDPPLANLSADDLERIRLQAGIPAIPDDLGPADLPNEGRLESVAISYTKGCYLGQEVMARLKAMGQVRRRLTRVTGLGSFPAERPATLYQSGKRVGEVRTWVADGAGGWLGLAMLSLLSLDANAPLSLSPAGPGTITVVGES
jgi:folate-binding protein YgfZ